MLIALFFGVIFVGLTSLVRVLMKKNKFSGIISKINRAPDFCRSWLLTKAFCSKVKFAGTTGIRILEVSNQQVIIALENKKKVQNHIGGVHAVAAAVIAESATGIVFGMNLRDSSLPLLKTMKMSYVRRMQGAISAKATLTEQQIADIQSLDKGEMIIDVVITDESGQEPIESEMTWAWIPKDRK